MTQAQLAALSFAAPFLALCGVFLAGRAALAILDRGAAQ
jgi:hypothetical protein